MAVLPSIIAAFGIMLCLGGVYAWSLFVPELIREYGFSAAQTQLVFGMIIAVFPATMLWVGRLQDKLKPRTSVFIAAGLFGSGYLLSGFSGGNFLVVLIGIGVLVGMGTGFGYLTALTIPVRILPARKGLLTGIAAGGFGLAAVVLAFIVERLFLWEWSVLRIFVWIGLVYGGLIAILGCLLRAPALAEVPPLPARISELRHDRTFRLLTSGIFCGTFAGLLVIGNLKPIGALQGIEAHTLVIGISGFALANFAGRLGWGALSDKIGARQCIAFALFFQGAAIALLMVPGMAALSYLALSAAIGFGFGANFVLFAKETSQTYGVDRLAKIYPYVFIGYAIAGIFGPLTGGLIYDLTGTYGLGILIAAAISAVGGFLFLKPSDWRVS
jgi:OFA family oxalate/formate antiporter-like MFS transporter